MEANKITGDANMVCLAKPMNVTYFGSDCGGNQPAVNCSCCTICCEGEASCNDLRWSANLDPKGESDYKRKRYEFGHGVVIFP